MMWRFLLALLVACTAFSIHECDQKFLLDHLGYIPSNFYAIAARTATGEPLVIQTYPIKNHLPFPTLYWLCHNDVSRAVADLERRGFSKQIEAMLQNSPSMSRRQAEAHVQYASARWKSLSECDRVALTGRQRNMMEKSGIAGANCTNIDVAPSVKCLHAHYAHFRAASNNAVGELVHGFLKEKFPDLVL